jgi:hypothetical protein
MAFIPKGSPIFDQLPSQFESYFPSEQSYADGKLASVLARAGGKGVDLLTRVQAETIMQGLQLVQQQKAILVGDFLTARMPQLVGFATDQWGQKVPQGLFASVPFPTSAIEDPLLGAMAGVGLNLALNAISAVPIVGKIIGLVVNIGMALARLFKAQDLDPELPPLLLPWTRYGRDKDEDLVNKGLILTTAGRVEWTHVWLPGLGGAWSYERVSDGNGKEMPGGRVFAPLDGKQVGWSRGLGLGAIPNTLRVAGPVQTLVDNRLRDLAYSGDRAAKNEWERQKRFVIRGDSREKAEGLGVYNELERPPSVIDTGAFYPAFAGIAGQLWQQVQQRGNPDMFKVEANVVRDAWQDYWGAFFEAGFELADQEDRRRSGAMDLGGAHALHLRDPAKRQEHHPGHGGHRPAASGPARHRQDFYEGVWPGHAGAAHTIPVRRDQNARGVGPARRARRHGCTRQLRAPHQPGPTPRGFTAGPGGPLATMADRRRAALVLSATRSGDHHARLRRARPGPAALARDHTRLCIRSAGRGPGHARLCGLHRQGHGLAGSLPRRARAAAGA